MAKSLIKKLVAGPVTLPDPFSDVILTPERPSAVVAGAPSAVITQLGGADRINGVLSVSEVPDSNPVDAVAFGLADVQASSAASPRTSFVYRPGGVADDNVYTSWPTMFTAMASVEGSKTVLADDSITSPAIVPAGSYDFTDVELRGVRGLLTALHLAQDVVFTSSRLLTAFMFRAINIRNLGTAPAITLAGTQTVNLDEGATISASGAAPLITATGGAIQATKFSAISEFGRPSTEVTAGALSVLLGEGARIDDGAFGGAGDVTVSVASNSARVDSDQPALTGTFAVNSNTFLAVMADRWQIPAVSTLTGVHGALHRVDTTSGSVTINLPPSTPGTIGQSIIGKKITSEAINEVIMDPAGADTIEGLDRTTGTSFGVIHLVDNGDGSWSTIHPTQE